MLDIKHFQKLLEKKKEQKMKSMTGYGKANYSDDDF